MRDLTNDTRHLSINTATIKKEPSLAAVVTALAAAGIPGIAPWRDQVQATGVKEAARLIAGSGLAASGLIRAGVFTSEGRAGFQRVLDDNRRAVDEAAGI